jgi:hypothetical protein
MFSFFYDRPQLSARLAMAAGVAWLVCGVMQVTGPHEFRTEPIEIVSEHVLLGVFTVALLLTAPALLALSRHATGRTPAVVASAGLVLLSGAVTTTNVMAEDPSWFVVAAPLANAAWLFGMIALAVLLRRAGGVSTAVWAALPLTWIAALPLSAFGGPALTGAYWLAVGYLMLGDVLERRGLEVAATA